MLPSHRLAPTAWLATLSFLCQTEAKQAKKGATQIDLPHHSFAPPLEYANVLGDWIVSGASIFERDVLLLHPGVAERQGFAWNTRPLKTNNFQVTFDFYMHGQLDVAEAASDQSFAMWFVRQDIGKEFNETHVIRAKSWHEGLKEQGFLLSGSKGLFEGVGVIFSNTNSEKKPASTVSFVANDNHQTLEFGSDVPGKDAKVVDFRNRNPVQFTMRIEPAHVTGHMLIDGTRHECFSVDRKSFPVKADGYLGFSAWSGSAQEGKSSDFLSIGKVAVVNFDDESVGEELVDVPKKDQAAMQSLMAEETRHFESQKDQKEHIGKITSMLSQYIMDSKPETDKMAFQIQSMMDSLNAVDGNCRTLTKEMHLLWHPKDKKASKADHKSHVQDMMHEVMGLKRLLAKEGVSQMEKLEVVHSNLLEFKDQASKATGSEALGKITAQATRLEQTVQSRGSQMSWMMMFLLASVVAIGYLMWQRMRYYEKKHFI